MAVRSEKPGQGTNAAMSAVLVLAALIAAPVLAAPERDLLCAEEGAPTLEVSATDLTATPVNNSEELLQSHLLKPRTDSAVRTAFADDNAEVEAVEEESEDAVDTLTTEPVLPSASDREPATVKRQMYRRDI